MTDDLKVCSKCKTAKPRSEFHTDRSCKDGLAGRCKTCQREQNRVWRKRNPEKVREHDRRYRERNPEKMRERNLRWQKRNPEKVRQKMRRWYERNREKARERNLRWQKRNPEKVREAGRKWRKRNPEKMRERKLRWQKRNPEKYAEYCARSYLSRGTNIPTFYWPEVLVKTITLNRKIKRALCELQKT